MSLGTQHGAVGVSDTGAGTMGQQMTVGQAGSAGTGTLLTVGEVAAVLRVSNMTVYRLIKSGDLPALRIGKNYRIRQGDLDVYLSSGVVRADESNG